MKPENYINVVEKFNSGICKANENLYSDGLIMEYQTNYYVDNISFLGMNIFNSECDDSIETEEELEGIIREKILNIINALCLWQHYDNFGESQRNIGVNTLLTINKILNKSIMDKKDVNQEERVPNGTMVKDIYDNTIYKIVDAIETNNQWGYGVYLYRFEGKLDTGFGLYRRRFEVLKSKNTRIISAFPATGKSYLFDNPHGLLILDSDSSKFSWLEKGVRHPDFPQNYIDHIKDNLGKVDIILVSSHKVVRDALIANNINFTLAYPELHCKEEYIQRYINRGNNEEFINMMRENWDKFFYECDEQECLNKYKLGESEFLSDYLFRSKL